MSLVSFPPAPRRPSVPPWAMAIVAAWLVAVAAIELARPAEMTASLCAFRSVTGVPCPTCGTTRMVRAAWGGDLLGALLANPAMAVAAVLVASWLVSRLLFGRAIRVDTTPGRRRLAWSALAVGLALNWAWLILRDGAG